MKSVGMECGNPDGRFTVRVAEDRDRKVTVSIDLGDRIVRATITPPWGIVVTTQAGSLVLERVREVFPPKRMDRFATVLWVELWGNRRIGHVWYRAGDYARAARAVLREMEEG